MFQSNLKTDNNCENYTHYPDSSGIFFPFADGCGPLPTTKYVSTNNFETISI